MPLVHVTLVPRGGSEGGETAKGGLVHAVVGWVQQREASWEE